MELAEAVALAKQGKEEGYVFLYENTYKSKYYLALQYMREEETAKDVIQEAYVRAFAKISTLEKPEAFSSWLGMIVANTAKNIWPNRIHPFYFLILQRKKMRNVLCSWKMNAGIISRS